MRGDEVEGLERKINLLRYITPVSKQNKDIRAILASETVELQALWDALCEVFDNQFIRYMGEYGVKQWEHIFDVIPYAADTLEIRRNRILALIKGNRPYTLKKLQEMLDAVFGEGIIKLELHPNEYELRVRLSGNRIYSASDTQYLANTLETIIPKNLIIRMKMYYDSRIRIFCEGGEYDSEKLIESLTYNGEGIANYSIGIVGRQYFGDRLICGAGFTDVMELRTYSAVIGAEFDREVLVSGN